MALARHLVEMPHALPHEVPSSHISGVARDGEARFVLDKLGFDSPNNAFGNLVLDRENVRKREIVALGPQVRTILRVDQSRRDAQAFGRITHTSLKCVTSAMSVRSFPDIDHLLP